MVNDFAYFDHPQPETGLTMSAPSANEIIPFTHVGVMLPFVSYLEATGTAAERHLRKAKIPPSLLEHPEAPIPLRLAYRFVNEAYRAVGIENPGLHVGRACQLDDLGEFGQVLLHTRNVLEYLETGVRLIGAVTSVDRYRVRREGEWVRLSHAQSARGIPEADKQHDYLFSMAVTINTLRRVAGPDWCPAEVRLPAPGNRALAELYEWLPDTRVITGGRVASFLFPAAFLALPMPRTIDAGHTTGAPWLKTPAPTQFVPSVALLVESLVADGPPAMETTAEAAGLSVRSLRRRLTECGTSYSDVVKKTRIALAERWLAQGRPITEIALALGYTDRSNFTRAFRRLNGISPREYRDTLRFNGVRLD